MSKLYLASTAEGKTWSFGFSKQPKKPAYWFATEGELEQQGDFRVFKFTMFQARSTRWMLPGKATEKAKAEALRQMVASMKEQGLIKEAA